LPAILILSLIFTSPDGWSATLGPPVNMEIVSVTLAHLDEGRCAGGGATFRFMHDDQTGFWVCCEVTLNGRTFEVTRRTEVVVHLTDGTIERSTSIMASPDPCAMRMLHNWLDDFTVDNTVHGYAGRAMLFLRFAREFHSSDVADWRPVRYAN